jgi:hypothetical protein
MLLTIPFLLAALSSGAQPVSHAPPAPPLTPAPVLQGTAAAPIRITVVTHQEWSHIGGAELGVTKPVPPEILERMTKMHFAHTSHPAVPGGPLAQGKAVAKGRGCGGGRTMRGGPGRALALTNGLRVAVGLTPIAAADGSIRVDAVPPLPTLVRRPSQAPCGIEPWLCAPAPAGTLHVGHAAPPFLERLHEALLRLGPWEARAVSFVLGASPLSISSDPGKIGIDRIHAGCGIGVLLRMAWVFVVLLGRGLCGGSETPAGGDFEYTLFVAEVAAEEPPKYTAPVAAPAYTDEKVAPVEAESPVSEEN